MKTYKTSDDSRVAGQWWVKAVRSGDLIVFEVYPVEPGETKYADFNLVSVPRVLDAYFWNESCLHGWGIDVDYSVKYHRWGMAGGSRGDERLSQSIIAMEELKHALAPFVLREG